MRFCRRIERAPSTETGMISFAHSSAILSMRAKAIATMTDRRLLLLSNSRNYGQGYLDHAEAQVKAFLGGVRRVLFIPFAAVRYSFDQFAETVRKRFEQFGYGLDS